MAFAPPSPHFLATHPLILGIDLGTSGIRFGVYDPIEKTALAMIEPKNPSPFQSTAFRHPDDWDRQLKQGFAQVQQSPWRHQIGRIMADATSSTVCLSGAHPDGTREPATPFLFYDDASATAQAEWIERFAPEQTGARGASATLAKVMWLQMHADKTHPSGLVDRPWHQIDWLNHWLTQQPDLPTDGNNALKLGFDPTTDQWPAWVFQTLAQYRNQHAPSADPIQLPQVVPAGRFLAPISQTLAEMSGLSKTVGVYAGTTDSIAGFFATGAQAIGQGVTSLGSTLAIKLLSDRPVFSPKHGIYSHKVGPFWLVGGASNAGGKVLLEKFGIDAITQWCQQWQAKLKDTPSATTRPGGALSHRCEDLKPGLDYYPLLTPGERFPIADAHKMPKWTPQAKDQRTAFLGAIEGLVQIEKQGYQKLAQWGAPQLKQVLSVGGGRKNPMWQALRHCQLPVIESDTPHDSAPPFYHDQAAIGVARLLSLLSADKLDANGATAPS